MTDAVDPISATWVHPPEPGTLRELGRRARQNAPRGTLARRTTTDRDPLGIIDRQNASRLQELLPLRTERMSQSPFAFYRGTAALMAADLARDPHTGILVASCGDAHVANFGFYASPQRTLVFDLNDFDESAWAPWEWDLKRLVTSVVVAGQATSRDAGVIETAAREAVATYAGAIETSAQLSPTERYFAHFDLESVVRGLDKKSRAAITAAIKDAQKRTGERAVRRLTRANEHGRLVFVETPPTMVRLSDPEVLARLEGNVGDYLSSAQVDIRTVLSNYVTSDVALRVVGVGSVGTRCFLVAFQDGADNALLLQAKEANQSVLVEYGGIRQPAALQAEIAHGGQGARVVAMQRVLQAYSDPFLGSVRAALGDIYVRQFHDMKGGVDVEALDDRAFVTYAQACAAILARAHAQSPSASQVAGYIGKGHTLGDVFVDWALAYADLSRSDFEAFRAANKVLD
ncbi:DUF2252 domain-containing protein [Microbacterium fluvii]|uniref:DUF2252 domain-containing protein n=1 Tax=Microbacterium fluvii TaxID=415215 RepID=A0ABW2HEB7_9MICO|nr:DUF2252 domain-containing protein [Microbacterium fluvii]MCU4672831.1 DUF2252 domain-containing protein [Microbacterium fluvii]